MGEKSRERVIESFTLPASAREAAIVGNEALEAAGFDPKLYLAVIPAECALGGVVNSNRMIYVPGEIAAEHARLSAMAKDTFVAGEAGHPEGQRTWDIAVRFLGGETEITEAGVVKTRGLFGLLDTTKGRDIFTCWNAGMPIGVSLRGWAFKDAHTLDDKSPYTGLNPSMAGQTVWLRHGLELETYDPVPVPAFSTFFAPKGEAVAAFERLKNDMPPAAAGQESDEMAEKKGTEPQAAAPSTESAPTETPKIQTAEQLRAEHGELVDGIVKEAVAEALKQERDNDPLRGLDKAQMDALLVMAGTLRGEGPKAAQAAAKEAADIIRERLSATEARIEALEAKATAAEAAQAEAESKAKAAEAALAIRDSLDGRVKGVQNGEAIRSFVMDEAKAGKIVSAQEAEALFDRLVALQKGAVPPPVGDTVASAGASTKDEPAPATEADDNKRQAPGLLNTRFSLAEALKARRQAN